MPIRYGFRRTIRWQDTANLKIVNAFFSGADSRSNNRASSPKANSRLPKRASPTSRRSTPTTLNADSKKPATSCGTARTSSNARASSSELSNGSADVIAPRNQIAIGREGGKAREFNFAHLSAFLPSRRYSQHGQGPMLRIQFKSIYTFAILLNSPTFHIPKQ